MILDDKTGLNFFISLLSFEILILSTISENFFFKFKSLKSNKNTYPFTAPATTYSGLSGLN